ncbi:hypothetical protein ZWY2020_051621 [Hordeum vulgare]|nr:hypothetical protein ZWY2020_051621 [Hordeum vulgare]
MADEPALPVAAGRDKDETPPPDGQALKYVSFPVQTLAKCAKMIPVMTFSERIPQRRGNAFFSQQHRIEDIISMPISYDVVV